MSELVVPELGLPADLEQVALFKAGLDSRQPFASNAKANLVFKLAVEGAFNDAAWPVQTLAGQWFWVAILAPEGRDGVVDVDSFEKWESQLKAGRTGRQ